MKKLILIIFAALFLFSGGLSYAAVNFELIDLGSSVTADSSKALSINNEGNVVGYMEFTIDGWWHQRAIKWENEIAEILPLLDDESTTYGIAYAINDNNEIVGAMDAGGERPYATIWSNDGSVEVIYGNGWAADINSHSEAIVSSFYASETALWNDGAWEVIISGALYDVEVSYPNAINDLTQIVGTGLIYEEDHDDEFAFLWRGGHFVNLNGVLDPFLTELVHLDSSIDINNLSQIVGELTVIWSGLPAPFSTSYVLDNGRIKLLGFSGVQAINDHSQIVGSHYLYMGGKRYDLYDLIETKIEYDDLKVVDINNEGQIVGSAVINKSTHAVLLNPKSPKKPLAPPRLRIIPRD